MNLDFVVFLNFSSFNRILVSAVFAYVRACVCVCIDNGVGEPHSCITSKDLPDFLWTQPYLSPAANFCRQHRRFVELQITGRQREVWLWNMYFDRIHFRQRKWWKREAKRFYLKLHKENAWTSVLLQHFLSHISCTQLKSGWIFIHVISDLTVCVKYNCQDLR